MITTFITSSVLIAAVLLLRKIFKGKVCRRYLYAMWLVVAARLLIVPLLGNPGSTFSVMNLFETQKSFAAAGRMGYAGGPAPALAGRGQAALSGNIESIWFAGMAVCAIVFLFYNLNCYRKLRKERVLYEMREHGISVWLVEGLSSPCLFGKGIYLPVEAVADKKKLSHILAHEFAHYRRLDELWAFVRCVCVALYWYHPLVWAAAYISRQDGEMACDEAALRLLGNEERYSYGETLLALAGKYSGFDKCIGYSSRMSGSGRALRERVAGIARGAKNSIPAVFLLGILLFTAAGCTFTGKEEKRHPATEQPDETAVTTETLQNSGTEASAETIPENSENDYILVNILENSGTENGEAGKESVPDEYIQVYTVKTSDAGYVLEDSDGDKDDYTQITGVK